MQPELKPHEQASDVVIAATDSPLVDLILALDRRNHALLNGEKELTGKIARQEGDIRALEKRCEALSFSRRNLEDAVQEAERQAQKAQDRAHELSELRALLAEAHSQLDARVVCVAPAPPIGPSEAEIQLGQELERLRGNYTAVVTSTSWTLTKPWRVLGRFVKRHAG